MKIGAQISPVPQRWNHHYRLTNPVPQEKLQEKLSADQARAAYQLPEIPVNLLSLRKQY
ncbi:MAG TPA: hypothetical protein VG322_14915 [Candidatus Acidoferrales bacterium]|jgi:hypothetical protein|nr:hypothetical protein [Candidatus Acidoferrales bacterium]